MNFKAKQIAYPLLWDRMPLDISCAFPNEKPAGKHGWIHKDNRKMIFDDGTEVRFWGTNFNSGACFPSHSYSEQVAHRLSMTGINLVRFHQMDSDWATPNIFQFEKGAKLKDTRTIDKKSLERLDYLVYCLKEEGIYIYMDFLTYRRFRSGDGLENTHLLREAAKPYSSFSRAVMELQKEYIHEILNHKNPYTGMCYKDDPCIVMAEIINESDLFNRWNSDFILEPYRSEILAEYRAYAKEMGEEVVSEDFTARDQMLITEFLLKKQHEYFAEMYDYMRSEGAKFLITGTNWYNNKEVLYSSREMDFTDAHTYHWLGNQKAIKNIPHIKSEKSIAKNLCMFNLPDKPFVCSEWDVCWPNEFRADSTIWFAAMGALQGWSGYAIHTYRYSTSEDESITKKIGAYKALGGAYHRGVFDTFNDPAKFGLFYHAALLFRRADVSEAKEIITVGISEEDVRTDEYLSAAKMDNRWVEQHGVRVNFGVPSTPAEAVAGAEVLSDTGELYRDTERGIGYINSPRTRAYYGFVGNEKIDLSGFSVSVENDFATVALSSLTDDDIEKSDNLLLTAVGRADNKDVRYNEDHTEQLCEGSAPIMIDVIEAEIAIPTERCDLRVWAVDYEGFYTGEIPAVYEDGYLKFTIGKEFASMYYLIQAQ